MTDNLAPHVSIVIPVRDETLTLRIMLRVLDAIMERPHEIIVVYDRPEDASAPVVAEEALQQGSTVRRVLNENGRGVANALRAGVAAARCDRILLFAADDLGPVVSIEPMMRLMDSGCQFVSCTRYAHGGQRLGGSQIGKFLSATANGILRVFSCAGLSDLTTGLKMFRRQDLDRLVQTKGGVGWAFAFEMAINAHKVGLVLGEVPITSVDRLFGGQSTMRLVPWIVAYFRFFRKALVELPPWQRRPKVQVALPPQ